MTSSRDIRPSRGEWPAVTVVITSYNYARYIGAAVESALAQTRPCEVIVVDDGSTDDSVKVLQQFGSRIRLILKRNGGEASAMHVGAMAATGDFVIFLDSDDLLYPKCAAEAAKHAARGTSKVQWRLDVIGADSENLNNPFPVYPPGLSPERVMELSLAKGCYPTPCNTGIAYSREFLRRVLPVSDERLAHNGDVYLSRLAPLYGRVVTLPMAMGAYRSHGSNFWEAANRAERYSMYVAHEIAAQEVFRSHAVALGFRLPPARQYGNLPGMEYRLLSLRLTPERHPVPEDTRWGLLRTALGHALHSPEHGAVGRAIWSAYLSALAVAPTKVLRLHLPHLRQRGRRFRATDAIAALSRLRFRSRRANRPEASPGSAMPARNARAIP